MTTLLLDADVLVYSFAFSEQQVIRWDRDLYTQHAWLDPTKVKLDTYIHKLMELTDCSEVKVALSDLDYNFRKEVYGPYKMTRAGLIRPILFGPLREFFIKEHDGVFLPRLEGDDVLATWATDPATGPCVIGSIDKDLRQIPGLHYNWTRPDRKVEGVTPLEGELSLLTQILMGDRTDNYPGIKGCGPKTAEKLLGEIRSKEDLQDVWADVIVKAYQKAGFGEEFALTNARCARLLRFGDLAADGSIRLWHPEGEEVWLGVTQSAA